MQVAPKPSESELAKRRCDFMAAMRPYSAYDGSKAMEELTPGFAWPKCSKGFLADVYANAHNGVFGTAILKVSIAKMLKILKLRLTERAHSRAEGVGTRTA